jgi:hypothetical protein
VVVSANPGTTSPVDNESGRSADGTARRRSLDEALGGGHRVAGQDRHGIVEMRAGSRKLALILNHRKIPTDTVPEGEQTHRIGW